MTRQQTLDKLKNPNLSTDERERLEQYLHYIDVEGVSPRSVKRPTKKFRHTNNRNAGKA